MESYLGLVITHKNCMDGCACKFLFKEKLGNDYEYLDLDYSHLDKNKNNKADELINHILSYEDKTVIIADFMLKYDLVNELLEKNNKVVIIDHHDSNIKDVEKFEKRIENGENLNLEIKFAKKNECSATMLTWNYLYPEKEPTNAVKYISDGDIWAYVYGLNTSYFYMGCLHEFEKPESIPEKTFINLLNNDSATNNIIEKGKPVYDEFTKNVKLISQNSIKIKLFEQDVFLVKCGFKYKSHVGNYISKTENAISLMYEIDEDEGFVKCSLRSIDPIVTNKIAEKLGGGGHPQASAFSTNTLDEFNALLLLHGNNIIIQNSKNKIKIKM